MAQGTPTTLNFNERVPAARLTGLVMSDVGDQTLVYDTERHQIHHLSPTSARIWHLCDGKRSLADIARDAGVDVEVAHDAVNNLAEANLLDGELTRHVALSGQSRRKLLTRAALAGAGVAIVSVSAPAAANHISCDAATACDFINQICCGQAAGGGLREGSCVDAGEGRLRCEVDSVNP